MTKRVVYTIIAASAVLAASAGLPVLRGIGQTDSVSAVATYRVVRGEFVRRVYADGNLEAVKASQLSPPPQVRGPLKIAWLAEDGVPVEAGDVVVRFDPTDLEEKLREGTSDRDTADSKIAQKRIREDSAVRNLERDADMAARELEHVRAFQSKDPEIFSRIQIIESEIDAVLANERRANAEVVKGIRGELAQIELDLLGIEKQKAELQIGEAQTELQELELKAPHAGLFVLKEIWGDTPQVGTMVWQGNPVAEIPKLDEMQAKIYVLEADAGGLEAGAKATVVLDAHPDQVYEATVTKVDALAMRRNRRVPVQYFAVVLKLARTDPATMKPGQRVRAVLVLDELDDVVSVPRQAVFHKEGQSIVYVRNDGGFDEVEVKLGASALGRVVVDEGLDGGQIVALRDPTRPLQDADPGGENSNGGVAKAGL